MGSDASDLGELKVEQQLVSSVTVDSARSGGDEYDEYCKLLDSPW